MRESPFFIYLRYSVKNNIINVLFFEEKDLMRTIRRNFGIFILIIMMVIGASVGVLADSNASDWMSGIDGDTKLSSVTIPGTHDSATKNIGFSYVFKCQDTSIAKQLENGYRYLDIRLALDGDGASKKLILKHSFAKCRKTDSMFSDALTLNDVLNDVYSFLDRHPSETVIMCMKAENGKDDTAEINRLLHEAIEERKSAWYLGSRIPTLDEARGKIVLATRVVDKTNIRNGEGGLKMFWEDQGESEIYEKPYVETAINGNESHFVQDRYNYAVTDKIDALGYSLANCMASEQSFFLNFASTSGSGIIGHPKKYADEINDYLHKYEWKNKENYGIVIVDFGTKELAEKIYKTNE